MGLSDLLGDAEQAYSTYSQNQNVQQPTVPQQQYYANGTPIQYDANGNVIPTTGVASISSNTLLIIGIALTALILLKS